MKPCPQCGAEIPEYASKCKYCDYRFEAPVIETKKSRLNARDFLMGKYSFVLLIILAILVFVVWNAISNREVSEEKQSIWMPLSGNVYTNVGVFMGNDKTLQFKILGGNDECSFGRGLLVQYPNGTTEWKERGAIISNPSLYVFRDDPAISLQRWEVYPCL